MISTKDRFKINLPDGWEDQTVYTFRGPDNSGVQHMMMLNVDRHLQAEDITSFAEEKTDPIIQALQGVEVLKDEEVTLENGNPVYEFVYKWVPSDGNVIFQKHVFVIKDGIGFNFSAGFSKKTIKTIGTQMSEIVESLLPGTYLPIED